MTHGHRLKDTTMPRFLLFLVSVFLTFSPAAFAQVRSLSLDEAIELAMKQNKTIAVARLGVKKAESQVREAFGTALPTLNVSAGYNYNIQLPVFFFPNPQTGEVSPLRFGLTNTYNVTTQVQQLIFSSAAFTAISASKLYSDAAEAQLDAAVAEVVTETKKRYYQAVAATGYASVADASLTNILEVQRNITAFFAEGLVAEFDKIRADVAVANARPMVLQAKSGKYAAIAALQTYIGMNLADSISVSEGGFPALKETPQIDGSVAMAVNDNLDLRALRHQIDVSSRMVDLSRSDYYPTLAAFGQWQNQGQSESLSGWQSASSTVVGLNFSMNLFNGLRSNERVEQSQIDVLSAKERLNQLTELIHLQVRTLINQLESARERSLAQKSTVEQAQRGYEIARIRYREGTGSLLEINDAETSLAQAKLNAITALVDYHVTRADFERATGQVDRSYWRFVRKDGR
ncbi:MAG: TolC family protein [Candidatus Kapabacteria bacterium]|nr:TolC family protein [Candidatus Kapabacteria bacterium]